MSYKLKNAKTRISTATLLLFPLVVDVVVALVLQHYVPGG